MQQIWDFASLLFQLPWRWLMPMAVIILLSRIEATLTGEGALTFSFRLTSVTAVLVALVWLPTSCPALAAQFR